MNMLKKEYATVGRRVSFRSGLPPSGVIIYSDDEWFTVQFDSPIVNGHNGLRIANHSGKMGHCWNYLRKDSCNLFTCEDATVELI